MAGVAQDFLQFPSVELANSRHQILRGKERPVLGALHDERMLNQYTRTQKPESAKPIA